jgi:putative Mg2+ transporter-C (MgtC) family protein
MLGRYAPNDALRFDPAGLIQAVASGIGFLGAGTIFVSRGRDRVEGLTTAASIWATAAVGAAAALERYVLAAGSTLILLVVLHVMLRFTPQHGGSSD